MDALLTYIGVTQKIDQFYEVVSHRLGVCGLNQVPVLPVIRETTLKYEQY